MQHHDVETATEGVADRLDTQQTRRLPKASIRILKRWYLANLHNPRPSEVQKNILQKQTRLTLPQISNWFANARRRGINKPSKASDGHHQPISAPVTIPNLAQASEWQSMHPFERWRNSPPEQEPASLFAIADAINSDVSNTIHGGVSFDHTASYAHLHSTYRSHSETSFESMSSFWTSGSDSSAQSEQSGRISNGSNESFGEAVNKPQHVRRRSGGNHKTIVRTIRERGPRRMFQCTFCTDTFKTKYDWTRHEGTLHLVLEKWICAPRGPTLQLEHEESLCCIFCDEKTPSDSHVSSHNYTVCSQKPLAQRSFRRKDHLRQHLRLVHNVTEVPSSIDSWKSTITHVKSRCGFCGELFTLWSERNEHIGDHFRDGAKMSDWKGDRGLDATTALMVENAMSPYLIGAESNEFEPFSATRTAQRMTPELNREGAAPSKFQDLTAQLAEYVSLALRAGILVTDELVRRQARLIMFGDDDAWNQTPADNDEWLHFFKRGLGLGVTALGTQQFQDAVEYQMVSTTSPYEPSMLGMALPPAETYPYPYLSTEPTSTMFGSIEAPALYHADPLHLPASNWPLAWQTPECMVEFRLMQQNGLAPSIFYTTGHYQPSAAVSAATTTGIALDHSNFSSIHHTGQTTTVEPNIVGYDPPTNKSTADFTIYTGNRGAS